MTFLERLDLSVPIIQAPMAGFSTPELASTVSNAGGLGSIAVGAVSASQAHDMIQDVRTLTRRAFNVNLFVHSEPEIDKSREAQWLEVLRPVFHEFDAEPPDSLNVIYKSFAADDEMFDMLIEAAPPVVSFHFGLPDDKRIKALKRAGCILLATATNFEEADAIEKAGLDGIVAQGFEAGGHRGVFDPDAVDDRLGMTALTRELVKRSNLPIISAGGIMDGAGIRAVLDLGATAAQLGTAFIACPESAADAAYRDALTAKGPKKTIMTKAISGRPARCLSNRFTDWASKVPAIPPDYPLAYDAGKALHKVANSRGETGFRAQWAGQGVPLIRTLPAAMLMKRLHDELAASV